VGRTLGQDHAITNYIGIRWSIPKSQGHDLFFELFSSMVFKILFYFLKFIFNINTIKQTQKNKK
jgi:hypothetical protein